MPGKHAPAAERFWRHVRITDNCWEWTASLSGGYGQFKVAGRPVRANRFSWELHFGPIPPDLLVCHHCDNPLCVRPDHLFLGTTLHNTRDAIRKGRLAWAGAKAHPHSRSRRKLTDDEVRAIRVAFREGLAGQRVLAETFGVDRSNICRLLAGKHYVGVGELEAA